MDRRAYYRAYYLTRVKPFRKKKEFVTTHILYNCPFCGALKKPGVFELLKTPKIMLKFFRGYRGISYKDVSVGVHEIYSNKLADFIEHMKKQAVFFAGRPTTEKINVENLSPESVETEEFVIERIPVTELLIENISKGGETKHETKMCRVQ